MIRVDRLGKKFKIYPRRSGRLVEWLTLGRATRHQDFWALKDVSFNLSRGGSLGIIGVNGSGKSTLLKILSGAMYPTDGTFEVGGRVLSLLELGTGLNTELTGRQNIINSAALLGFPPDYARQRLGQIEAFAELGEFFDRPVRLYSSGMLVRLSFSMFACFDPEIFIVDEALSVGDVFFQQKCARRIQEMRANGTTMLFVSHDLAAVEALCDRVLLLHGGRVRHDGDKKTGISLYYAVGGASLAGPVEVSQRPPSHEQPLESSDDDDATESAALHPAAFNAEGLFWQLPDRRDEFGEGNIEISSISFRREGGRQDAMVERGQWLEVYVRITAIRDAASCNIGLNLYDRLNRLVFARSWLNADMLPLDLRAGDVVIARFHLQLDVEPGEYMLSFGAGQAIADSFNATGWNQDIGGTRYTELPRAAVIAVTPRADRRRKSFGPANLHTRLDRMIVANEAAGHSSDHSTASVEQR
jgi:ABC-type polysaccharide/polyol phosphate transport system ATPase subunit